MIEYGDSKISGCGGLKAVQASPLLGLRTDRVARISYRHADLPPQHARRSSTVQKATRSGRRARRRRFDGPMDCAQ